MALPLAEPATATVAEHLAGRLAAHGVERAFGFPGGGGNLDLIDALERAGVEFVLTRTEGAAALMAAATAEITGAAGVVIVGNGPGLASVVNGVAHAHLDRVPLVVISDRFTDAEVGTSGHQILDQRALLAPLVRFGATLEPATAADAVETALTVCRTAPAGPVHLDLPRDVAGAIVAPRRPASSAPRPEVGEGGRLREIAAALDGAARPVVLVGLEANGRVDPAVLVGIVERLGAAVLTTYKAKGAFPERHERWAGILTGGEIEGPILERAGAILAVGLDPVELLSKPWTHPAPVLALRACAEGLDYQRPRLAAVGDLGAAVRILERRLEPRGERGWPPAELAAHRESIERRLRLAPDEPLTGWRVIVAMADELPPTTTVAVDAGAHMFPATSFWRAAEPCRFLISNGLATMGFAVPAALAAARARPGHPAVAVTGDGGMAYHGFELETAARIGARIIVVVVNDSSLSLIRIKHEAKGYARRQLDFGMVGFERIAEGLGARGSTATTEPELRSALRRAMDEPRSSVIDARISGSEYGRTLEAIRG